MKIDMIANARRGLAACIVAGLVLLASSLAHARHHAHGSQSAIPGAFDYYLLSLSVAPSFCALSPYNQAKSECRQLTDAAYRQTPLTVHGLWPNLARVSVNRQPQDCPAPPLPELPADLQHQLELYMPGGPGLARHEWSRHGSCSGLSPEAYFETLVHLAASANATVGAVMRDRGLFGHSMPIADLLAGVARTNPALAAAIVVSCQFPRGGGGDRALVGEIRVVLSKQLAPVPVESVGLRQNSGCPQGAGFLPG